jgi:AcrR family transcriptional regulator
MSPRKRTIADSDVVAAAARIALKSGAEPLKLADVAVESGLAAPTLVQRFGSRDGLLAAVGAWISSQVGVAFEVQAGTELQRLELALSHLPIHAHLRFFHAQHGQAAAYSLELRKHIAFSLAVAVDGSELAPCDVAEMARRIQLSYYGAATADYLEGRQFEPDMIASILAEHLDSYL